MQAFWEGFEKRAFMGMVRQGMRSLGNLTGVRQLARGTKMMGNLESKGHIATGSGPNSVLGYTAQGAKAPQAQKSMEAARANLASGGKRLAGTAAVGAGAMWTGNKMFGSPSQPAMQQNYY